MNVKFNILWFEDNVEWLETEKRYIKEILKAHYLKPCFKSSNGSNGVRDDVTSNDYDLILMDYKLADDKTGIQVMAEIRNNNVLADTLFYSSDYDGMVEALRNKLSIIDGVYICKRDSEAFIEKARRIIDKIVRRSEDIVNLRGFVLDNTSAFEDRIAKILREAQKILDEFQKGKLDTFTSNLLTEKQERLEGQIKELSTNNSEPIFKKANNDPYLLSINDRLRILQCFLNLRFHDEKAAKVEGKEFKEFYIKNISEYRNKLSHLTIEDRTFTINNKTETVDIELFNKMRKNIAKIDSALEEIEDSIKTQISSSANVQ